MVVENSVALEEAGFADPFNQGAEARGNAKTKAGLLQADLVSSSSLSTAVFG